MIHTNLQPLEFDKVRLLINDLVNTPLGQEIAQSLTPYSEIATIKHELSLLSAIRQIRSEGFRFDFGSFKNIFRETLELKRKKPILEAIEQFHLASAMQECSANQQIIENEAERFPILEQYAESMNMPEWLADEILTCIDFEGNILDEASPELAKLRASLGKVRNSIQKSLTRFFDESEFPNYVQDDFITIRGGRMVIPIKIEHRNKYKGIVHDRSRGGDSLFFEPLETVELNNKLANVQGDIRREEIRILARLTDSLYTHWDQITAGFESFAKIDFVSAKAGFAELTESVEPEICDDNTLEIIGARHPLLDQRLYELRDQVGLKEIKKSHKAVVPIDIKFGNDWNVLIVTGPNAGGKTVSLKTTGLLCLMAQAGMHVPALKFRGQVFNSIVADIGDAQDIIQHLSSFSSHLTWLKKIFEDVQAPSLILIDEIAAATDPGEGSALAMATLEQLREEGFLVMASTHLEALKAFAHAQTGMQNCSVEFDPDTLKPVYSLIYGLPGKSNALETAREVGLPKKLLDRAHYYLGDEGAKSSEIIDKLQRELAGLKSERIQAEKNARKLEDARNHYVKRLDAAEKNAQKEIDNINKEWSGFKRKYNSTLEELIVDLKKARTIEQARAQVKEQKQKVESDFKTLNLSKRPRAVPKADSGPLKAGDVVELIGLKQQANVARDWDKNQDNVVSLELNGKRLSMPRNALAKIEGVKEGKSTSGRVAVNVATAPVRTELNLIGQTVDEAIQETEKFLDEALLNGLSNVRVIHGRGSGRLRKAIELYLKELSFVSSWHSAPPAAGGDAVTVVELQG